MHKYIVFLIFLLSTQVSFSQLSIDWQNCFMSPGRDRVKDIIALENGFFILGTYDSKDVWLIRTDLNGNLLWDLRYGGSDIDEGVSILKTIDGNYIIVALSFSKDFDLIENPFPNSANYWIYKINPSGGIIWSKIVGGNGPDWPNKAIITNDGGIMIVGQSQSIDGDVGENYGYWDIWAIKLDSSGNKVWTDVFGSEGAEWADEVITDVDGSVLIGGTTSNFGIGNIDCDPFNEWWGESLIMKFDSNINLLWQQCYGGSAHELVANITPAISGYYASHYTESNDGDLFNSGYHAAMDIWITKLDSSGNLIWGKCYGGTQSEGPYQIINEFNDGLTIFGATRSNDADVSGNHSANLDIWVVRIDSLGTLKWQQCIGGFGDESSVAACKINENTYIIVSETFGSFISGDVNCNTTVQTDSDIWLIQVTDTTVVSRNEMKFQNLKVIPNPADEFIQIQDDDHNWKFFSLTNIMGVKLINDIAFLNQLNVDIHQYNRGLYIYTVRDMDGNFTSGKLMIE